MCEPKVNWLTSFKPSTVYPNHVGLYLTWLSPPKEGVFDQATNWCQCRDIMIEHLYCQFANKPFKSEVKIATDNIYIVALRKYVDKETCDSYLQMDKNWLFGAKNILNKLEEQMNWSLTEIQELSEDNNKSCRLFFISSSQKWMQAPQLLSLYLLIIKISKYKQTQSLKSVKQLHKIDFQGKTATTGSTIGYFQKVQPFLWKIINNVDKLFFYTPQKDMFINQKPWYGINNLITGKADREVLNRFKKVMEEGV